MEVEPLAGGKQFQGMWLVVDDQEPFLLSYEPLPEYFEFVDRQVIVDGEEYSPPPQEQHLMVPHLRVHSMELAQGETPIDPPPTRLPAPPVVDEAPQVKERSGRWTQATGTLESVQQLSPGTGNSAELRLADDAILKINAVVRDESEALAGETVTVLGRVRVTEDGEMVMPDALSLCPGHVERCGIDD